MLKHLGLLSGLLLAFCGSARADVLIVADEFPAMEVLARRLKVEEGRASKIVDQTHMPTDLAQFDAIVVYIHMGLAESAERAFIDFAEAGGRLVLLHHSISSGKRQNRDWFAFLGVELPKGDVDRGGYKWTEGVTVEWVNLAGDQYLMTNRVDYPDRVAYSRSTGGDAQPRPAFTLKQTEVYLNHVLKGPRTLLMGLKYADPQTGKTWMQDTAGWTRRVGKGWVIYFMPGHTLRDFENLTYGRIVLNAIAAKDAALK